MSTFRSLACSCIKLSEVTVTATSIMKIFSIASFTGFGTLNSPIPLFISEEYISVIKLVSFIPPNNFIDGITTFNEEIITPSGTRAIFFSSIGTLYSVLVSSPFIVYTIVIGLPSTSIITDELCTKTPLICS